MNAFDRLIDAETAVEARVALDALVATDGPADAALAVRDAFNGEEPGPLDAACDAVRRGDTDAALAALGF